MSLKSATNITEEEFYKSPYYKFKAKSDFYSLIFLFTVIFIASVFGAITKNMELYVGIPIAFVSLLGFFIILKEKKRF